MEVELEAGTLVIGDLHLDPEEEEHVRAFEDWLESIAGAPRLVILGDLFEYWIGSAQAESPGGRSLLKALADCVAKGTGIEVIPGNRDFLLDHGFEQRTGCRLHRSGFTGRLGDSGLRGLFLHGDELATEDRAYQRLRRVLRSAPVLFLARVLPGSLAKALARRLRAASRSAVSAKAPEVVELQEAAAGQLGAASEAQVLVCGHAHRFRDEKLAGGLRWLVVDAWGGPLDTLLVGGSRGIEPLSGPSEPWIPGAQARPGG